MKKQGFKAEFTKKITAKAKAKKQETQLKNEESCEREV